MTLTKDDLVQMGLNAAFDPDDLHKALVGSLEDRQAAVMRLAAGSWTKGWDECEAAFIKALALAGLNFALPDGRA